MDHGSESKKLAAVAAAASALASQGLEKPPLTSNPAAAYSQHRRGSANLLSRYAILKGSESSSVKDGAGVGGPAINVSEHGGGGTGDYSEKEKEKGKEEERSRVGTMGAQQAMMAQMQAQRLKEAEQQQQQQHQQQQHNRPRKGSLRKTAMLGTGRLRLGVGGGGGGGGVLGGEAGVGGRGQVLETIPSSPGGEGVPVLGGARDSVEVEGSGMTRVGYERGQQEQRWPPSAMRKVAGKTPSESTNAATDESRAVSSLSRKSTASTSTTDEDDGLSLRGSGLVPALKKGNGDGYFPSSSSLTLQHRRLSNRARSPLATLGAETPPPLEEWDYSETEWWGWVILILTWVVFVVGMGSCFGVWSWAWDVGETPYAPPELNDDPTLPIVGYYPALMILTGVMAWVWVVVAWVGMKYFKHAKMSGD